MKKRTVEEELLYLTGETVKVIISIRERCAENIFVYREKNVTGVCPLNGAEAVNIPLLVISNWHLT